MSTDIDAIVDFDRYPICGLDAPEAAKALVAQGHRRLAENGLFTLPGFVRPASLARMQAEARALAPHAHHHERRRDGVHHGGRTGLPRPSRVSIGCVGLDQMPGDSLMRTLYHWEGLTRFVGAVLRREPFYRSADPMVGCMLTVLGAGDELGWHFDANDGVVSLMLQEAGAGGAFEFAPFVSREDDGAGSRIEAVDGRALRGAVRARLRAGYPVGVLRLGVPAPGGAGRVGPGARDAADELRHPPGQVFEASLRRHFFGRSEPFSGPDARCRQTP